MINGGGMLKEKELFDPLFLNICRKKEVSALEINSGILEVGVVIPCLVLAEVCCRRLS